MERNKNPSEQTRFFLTETGGISLSEDFSTVKSRHLIQNFLKDRAIWKEIPEEGQLLLVEVNEDENAYVFDRDKLLKLETVDLDIHKSRKKYASAVITFPYDLVEISADGYLDLFGKVGSFVNHDSGGFFVLEKVGNDRNLVWREKVLKNVGLVNTKIFTSQVTEGFLIWSGRFKKEPVQREPVNIINREHPNKYYWVARRLWGDMIKHYEELGYGMYKQEETDLFKRLQASDNVHFDLQLIDQMLGVDLKSTCGCVWHVPIKKNLEWERVIHCPDKECDGVPKVPLKPLRGNRFPVYNLDETKTLEALCFDCGSQLKMQYRKISESHGHAIIQRYTYCEHCSGTIRVDKLKVLTGQLKS